MKASKKSKIKGAQFYKIGDKVETVKTSIGAWFAADIIDISPNSKCECEEECQCTFKLLFEGCEDDDDLLVVERKLNQIRQVSFSSISWDKLEVGMKVVINYNIKKPKQWGYWYDYIIEDIQKRDDVYFLKGFLLVGFEDNCQKLSVDIDSDNVADVLEIRPHATLEEKEMDSYETGVKPDYCKKCRNKPKTKCRTCCCCKCGIKKDFDLTVQCDECADWYHFYCIKPPIDELPDDDWYCPKCNNETHRAKLERRLERRKQKKQLNKLNMMKRSPTKNKCTPRKSIKSPPKSAEKNVTKDSDTENTTENSDYNSDCNTDVEMKEETKRVPENSQIWNQIKEMFPGYDLIQVTANVVRKKGFDGVISAANEFINNDVVNEHLWQEARQSLKDGKKAFLKNVKRIFTCAICCELLSDPITLSCKHSFCIDCFFRSLSVNVYKCCLCRVDIIHTQHYKVNDNLRKALALLFGKKLSRKIDA